MNILFSIGKLVLVLAALLIGTCGIGGFLGWLLSFKGPERLAIKVKSLTKKAIEIAIWISVPFWILGAIVIAIKAVVYAFAAAITFFSGLFG